MGPGAGRAGTRPGGGRAFGSGAPAVDVQGKDIAAARDGLDDLAVVAQNLSQGRHLDPQVAFVDHGRRPDAAHDLIFCDEGAAGLQQHDQKVEGAAAELDGLAIGEQLAGARKDLKPPEPNDGLALIAVRFKLLDARLIRGIQRSLPGALCRQFLGHHAAPLC